MASSDLLPALIQAIPTLVVGASTATVALYAARVANSYRRQLDLKTSERRLEAYAALWSLFAVASPNREAPITESERHGLYKQITHWYYENGHGMLLTPATREVYLKAKANLRCPSSRLFPQSLTKDMPSDVAGLEAWRGKLSQDQLSLLRTQMKSDLAIVGKIFSGKLAPRDIQFLEACGIDTNREPWTMSVGRTGSTLRRVADQARRHRTSGSDMVKHRDPKNVSAYSQASTQILAAAKRNSIIGLLAIAALSGIILAWAWPGMPSSDSLRYEAAKTAMQVIAVGSLGSLAALATFIFKHSLTREAEQRDQQLERWRRRVDNSRDKRAREDDLIRSLLEETLTAYNRVKRVRRLLDAETADKQAKHITRDVYERHMTSLMDEQLEFERLKRLAPFISDERLDWPSEHESTAVLDSASARESLQASYERIEKYLNKVIGEYQKNRNVVPVNAPGRPLAELTKLYGFIHRDFLSGTSDRIDTIIMTLQKAILRPLVLPDPGQDDAP